MEHMLLVLFSKLLSIIYVFIKPKTLQGISSPSGKLKGLIFKNGSFVANYMYSLLPRGISFWVQAAALCLLLYAGNALSLKRHTVTTILESELDAVGPNLEICCRPPPTPALRGNHQEF